MLHAAALDKESNIVISTLPAHSSVLVFLHIKMFIMRLIFRIINIAALVAHTHRGPPPSPCYDCELSSYN